MGLLDTKREDYERRRAEGSLHRNPFKFLTQPAPAGTVAGQPTDASQWEGTPMDNPINRMQQNLDNHPIYSGSVYSTNGLEELQQELSEGLIAEPTEPSFEEREQARQDRQDLKQRQEANMAASQAREIEMRAPNEGESEGETKAKGAVIDSSNQAKQQGKDTSNMDALGANATIEQITRANSLDLKTNAEQLAKDTGSWSTGWQKAWDNFSKEVDLTTMGLSLMMNSGNGRSLTENFAGAMSQGLAAVEAQKDKDAASATAGRAEARAERKTQVDEYEAETGRMNAYSKRVANALAAAQAAGGVKFELPTGAEQAYLDPWIDRKIDEGGFGAEMDDADKNAFKGMVVTAMEQPGAPADPNVIMEQIWATQVGIDDGMSIGPTYTFGNSRP